MHQREKMYLKKGGKNSINKLIDRFLRLVNLLIPFFQIKLNNQLIEFFLFPFVYFHSP